MRVNVGPRLVTLGVEFFFDGSFPLKPIVPTIDFVEILLGIRLEELIINHGWHGGWLSGQKGAHRGDSEIKQVFR
tara:strand:+ start:70 stop:294 length:225 start_codon:yes stop_codon:yes gene_type:complete